jgi:septal ring factor EnvC (AmiA/AmiB activator)
VAQPTNSERIDGLLKATSALDEHMKAIQRDLDNLEKNAEKATNQIHQLDTRLARIEESLKHNTEKLDKFAPTDRLVRVEEGLKNVEKELDKLRSSRFEIGKLFLAAFLGGGIAFGFNVLWDTIKAARTDRQTQTTKP